MNFEKQNKKQQLLPLEKRGREGEREGGRERESKLSDKEKEFPLPLSLNLPESQKRNIRSIQAEVLNQLKYT